MATQDPTPAATQDLTPAATQVLTPIVTQDPTPTAIQESASITPQDSILSPPTWGIYRAGICETLTYYHAYKGSLYSNGLLAKGFLIDKQMEIRDFLGAQVIISSL